MASLSFSRSSATTVWFTATGLTATHTYSLQVYGTKWVDTEAYMFRMYRSTNTPDI